MIHCGRGSGGSVAGVAVEGCLEDVATLGRDADGERVGTVGSGRGGAKVGPLIGRILTEEGDLFVGDGAAVRGEGAGDSEGLLNGGVLVVRASSQGGRLKGADCLSNGRSGGFIAGVAVERRLEEVGVLGQDADGEGVGTVGGGGHCAKVGPLLGGVLTEEGDLFVGDGAAVRGEGAGDSEGLLNGGVGV